MNLFASFACLPDARVEGRCLRQLVDKLSLLLCGTLAGCDDIPEICDYGRARLVFLRTERRASATACCAPSAPGPWTRA